MAKLVELIPDWLGSAGSAPTLVRFCGTTGHSSNTRQLLTSLCRQINALSGSNKEIPEVPQIHPPPIFL